MWKGIDSIMIDVLKDSLRYFKKYILVYIVCLILGMGMTVMMIFEPQIIALLVDRVITPALGGESANNSSIFNFLINNIPENAYWSTLERLSIAFFVLILLYFITYYLRWNISHYFGIKCENAMRIDAMNIINCASSSVIKQYSVGELSTITASDPQQIKDIYMVYIPSCIEPVIYIILASYSLSRIHLFLIVFPFITGIIFLFITRKYIKKSHQMYSEIRNCNVMLNTEAQENIYGIRTIMAYSMEECQTEKFGLKSNELKQAFFKYGDFSAKYNLLYASVQNVLYLISIILGIYLAVHFEMTNGEFTSFLVYMLLISNNFINFINQLGALQNSIVCGRRFFDFVKMEDKVAKSYGTDKMSGLPNIKFEDVSIVENGQTLLNHINLTIPYGKSIGIMGATGSGKSVFLEALQTHLEITDGVITINGKNIKEYSSSEIANIFSYAMQEVFLFSDSIEANIAFYNPSSSHETIRKSAKIAEADNFITCLPEGYKTIIGERGFGLSGGQKQRIAIARALQKNAPIIILDDSTSALDMETESKILENVKKYCREKTLLFVTHRVAAMKNVDEILFFENGCIVEQGNHEELMKLGGRYAKIYNLQKGEEVLINE